MRIFVLFLMVCVAVNSSIAGLVTQYEFAGNANDSIGSNDGVFMGDAGVIVDGQRGQVAGFDGYQDYVTVGDKESLESQELTLSFWARVNNFTGDFQGGIAKGDIFGLPTEFSYRMDFGVGGYLRAGITNTDNVAIGTFGQEILVGDNNWHLWTMTAGSGTVKIYKDGILKFEDSYSGSIDYTKTQNDFVIGARSNGSYAFDGAIDDVRFYDSVLTQPEIAEMVPEPFTVALLGLGIVGVVRRR